ncbi:MAG: sulfatase-like hydrolase/transferase [Candidatus Aminicenantes bacterium]|nr:sulfatase-like hydrolase/transferase [Candidatus Aminicenantes bacterium]
MKEEQVLQESSRLVEAIKNAYREGQEDEALEPIIKVDAGGKALGRFDSGDYVIFYDIRGEREVQLTQGLTAERFKHFFRRENLNLNLVTMIDYDSHLRVKVAFPSERKIKNTLAEVLSKAGLPLVKIAESEKAIHIGFFMNGKNDETFPKEERIIVPSLQDVSSYAAHPRMKAGEVCQEIISKLKDSSYPIIVANLANVDVVGHSEDKAAVLEAVRAVDHQLGEVIKECRAQGVTVLVTSDHGTVEEWLYPDGTVNTGHTKNQVPFILADFSSKQKKQEPFLLREIGELADVAPTILELLGIAKPAEMSGASLLANYPGRDKEKRRVLLLILDGWGFREEREGNLILEAHTPNFDKLWSSYPCSLLNASGESVGMPSHTVGNSEAGHLHIGAGRRVLLDRVKIDQAIQDGSFFKNEAFLWAMESSQKENKKLHLLGIVSHYSSHGTIRHLFALLRLAHELGLKDVYVHSLIGRRGEKPESGAIYIEKVEKMCQELSVGQVVTIMGRYWALDREENWDRVKKAYRALVYGEGTKVESSKNRK